VVRRTSFFIATSYEHARWWTRSERPVRAMFFMPVLSSRPRAN
jgi:hypothetical protein